MTAIMSSRMASENEGSSCRKKGREGKRMSTMRRSQKGEKGEEKKRKGLPQHTAETTSLDLRSNQRRSGPLCRHAKGTKNRGKEGGKKEGLISTHCRNNVSICIPIKEEVARFVAM